jgi:hypothetical protein
MKTMGFILLVSLWCSGALALNIGDRMPKLDPKVTAMKGVDGRIHDLNSSKGPHGTLVIFSCNHCPYVKAWEDRIRDLGNSVMDRLAVIQINSNDAQKYPEDSFEKMKERAQQKSFKFPYVVDATSAVARAFGATKTPEFFLFNKEGVLVYKGAFDDDHRAGKEKRPFLKNAIDQLVKGEKVDPSQTKAVGCGIKFREG